MPNKIRKLRRSIVHALHSHSIPVRTLARIAGQCISMTKAIVPGKLLLRNIYRIIASRDNWDSIVCLDQPSIGDLKWWLHALKGWNRAPLKSKQVEIQVETDASASGWGGLISNTNICAAGIWNNRVSYMHSNFRELLAVLQTVRSLQTYLQGKEVQILSDNITTVAYINHLGGNSPELFNLMRTLWSTARKHGISLSARYLAGSMNGSADGLSRIASPYE